LYFGGFWPGGFCPDNNFTFFSFGLIQLTLNTKQIMFWEDFVPGKILSRIGFSQLYHSIMVNIHQDQVLYFSGLFVVGGFCPNKNSTLSYVYHYIKHSYGSSFVFGGILSWGDFVPTKTLPYSMYSITVNIHTEQHMFWEDFIP
jgi:hypothetical protein